MGIIDPHRTRQRERQEPQLLAVARDERQLALDVAEQLGVVGSRPLEDRHPGDVRLHLVALEVQERGVERGHPLHLSLRSLGTARSHG